uniref:Ig-like domain-containing protein n=1 Tax=Seriola lalandi dorsalis TaxID=1841481 RepID=A0A3B4WZ24_SERLL
MNENYVLKHLHHVITEFSVSLGVSCEKLTPVKTEEFSSEGSTVTLSYNYSTKAAISDYFFWYRQYPGKPPDGDKTRMDLQISSAAVTDSAVYYCAVNLNGDNCIFTIFIH